MCFWGSFKQVLRFHGFLEGDRSKLGEGPSHNQYGFTLNRQKSSKAHWQVAALNRFVSRATAKYLSFFKTLKQAFAWTDECEAAFQDLKRYLSNSPLLSPSKEWEKLYLYLAVSTTAVSVALIREEAKKQLPVYYVS